jgi:DNA-binding response OmpR family regulator
MGQEDSTTVISVPAIILVVEDTEETRDGIEGLLKVEGYCVDAARDEDDALEKARRRHPQLILVSLGGSPHPAVIATARRIRERAGLGHDIPIVVFCVESLAEGAEVEIGENVYLTRPDNFDQLRGLLRRLLSLSATKH